MLFAYDYIDGALAKDGALYTQFLFLLGIGLIMTLIPFAYAMYLFVKFKKSNGKKFLSVPWFSSITSAQIVSIIFVILGWVFYYGEFILGTGREAGQLGFTLTLTFIVIAYAIAVVWYVILLFVPQFIWLLIEKDTVSTISSGFKREKIQTIIRDEEKGKIYINYLESKSTLKKVSFPVSSTMGQFVIQEVDSFGVKLTVGSQQEYFKGKVTELKTLNVENLKKAKEELAQKSTKTSDPKTTTTSKTSNSTIPNEETTTDKTTKAEKSTKKPKAEKE